jgi:probable HAF family extracellular repeat protein
MKSRMLTFLTAMTLFALPAIPVRLASAQVRYTVTDLGTLGGTFSQPNSISNRGEVVGVATLPGDNVTHGFFWQNGTMTDLGTLGGPISVAAGINESGEVVVGADTSQFGGLQNTICATSAICRMFIWRNGLKIPDLGTFPGGTDTGIYTILSFNFATSLINNNHQAAGTGDVPFMDPNNPSFAISHAFLWRKGVITDLGTLGGNNAEADAINDPGEVIGESETTTIPDPDLGFPPNHAFLWHEGVMTDLLTLGGKLSWAGGLNNRGQVAGVSTLVGDLNFHSFVWENGVLTDLGTFPGDEESVGSGINNQGHVVGTSGSPIQPIRATLWENGIVVDLNTQIPGSSGWQLVWAAGINARGQITGYGIHNNETHAFLLTPSNAQKDNLAQSATSSTEASDTGASRIGLPENLGHRSRWWWGQMSSRQK